MKRKLLASSQFSLIWGAYQFRINQPIEITNLQLIFAYIK